MNFSNYTEVDFVLDESFQNWVRKTDLEDFVFWETWLADHPEKKETAETAARIVRSMKTAEPPVPEPEIAEAWEQVQAALRAPHLRVSRNEEEGAAPSRTPVRFAPVYRSWSRIAAVVMLLLLVGASFWWLQNRSRMLEFRTGYGETASLTLPDSTTVTLNGNSRLTYPRHWSREKSREVWLEGEGFFSVTTKPGTGSAMFVVHTPDLDVEVLGTTFNVLQRDEKTRVVLNSGKVKLNLGSPGDTTRLLMKPGELVQYTRTSEQVEKKTVNPELYSSWRNKRLVFQETPLREVADLIEDTYGLRVTFENPAEGNRTLTGTIPSGDIDVLLMALAKSFDLSISRDHNQVILQNKESSTN
ncbi:FecR domain-containing protein [soil metagenome]